MDVRIDVDAKAVRQALTGLPKELRRELRAPLRASGEVVAARMRQRAPRRTGRLARGVRTRVDLRALKVRVVSTARAQHRGAPYDYGRALEFDARRYSGRFKWFYPAWDESRDEAVAMYEAAVAAALRRVGLAD